MNNHIFTIVFLFLLPPGTEAQSSFTQLTYENVLAKASELYRTQWDMKRRLCPLGLFNEPSIELGRQDLDLLKYKGHKSCQYCDPHRTTQPELFYNLKNQVPFRVWRRRDGVSKTGCRDISLMRLIFECALKNRQIRINREER